MAGTSLGGGMLPPELRRLVGISAAAHVVLLLAVILGGHIGRAAPPPKPQTFIPTKLVRLGQRRPEHLLPRLQAQQAPPPKPQVKVAPAAPAAPKTEARPQPAQAEALERAKDESRVASALDRLKRVAKDVPDEGDPEGVEGGEVTDVKLAILGNKFATEIYKCLKSAFAVEGMDRGRVRGRSATVLVRVQPDGKLFGQRILKSSGLPMLDRAVERAVVRCGKVSRPPDPLREAVSGDGIEIVFEP